ncbi:MAG: hypothetical protein ACRDJH_22605, partial [Thermomicrobiales bacterium]
GIVIGKWWRAPSGAWYYLVGATSEAVRVRVSGQIDQEASGRSLVVEGPAVEEYARLPKLTVNAYDGDGVPLGVVQSPHY